MSSDPTQRLARIRCNFCRSRIRAELDTCPVCGHDPRAFHVPVWVPLILLTCLGSLVVLTFFYNARLVLEARALATPSIPIEVASQLTATARAGPAPVTETRPPDPTKVALPPTLSPAPTLGLSLSPTRTNATATRASSPAPTRAGDFPTPTLFPTRLAVTATSAPLRTQPPPTLRPVPTLPPSVPTLSPTAAPVKEDAPVLVGPADGAVYTGPHQRILLTWQPHGLLPGNWYRLRVDFLDRSDHPYAWCYWASGSDSLVEFPASFHDDSSATNRSFRWNVTVVHTDAVGPSGCSVAATTASDPSPTRAFIWN